MNQIFHFHRIVPLFALFGLAALAWANLAEAAFYRYTDKNGVVHFTDRLESIPEQYRNQIKEYKEMKQPEALPPQEKGDSKDPAAAERDRQMKEAEQKKKEAEAKAAQERSSQEERLRIRQEKEKQIAELQEQITARQKEQRSLRTNWMVYDRNKLTQLNQEIEGLEKQIAALQKELSETP
jgi:hypothetical protein